MFFAPSIEQNTVNNALQICIYTTAFQEQNSYVYFVGEICKTRFVVGDFIVLKTAGSILKRCLH
jgi:hypothetical protein